MSLSCESVCEHGRLQIMCEWCFVKDLVKRMEKIESYIKMEDRVTASDVLIKLESYRNEMLERTGRLENKNRQIEEKISEKYAHPDVIGRLECLEKYKSLIDSINNNRNDWKESLVHIDRLIEVNKLLIERIEKLEEKQKFLETNWQKIQRLEKDISNWEEEFYFLKDKLRSNDKKPHKCPVCDGKGKVKHPLNGLLNCACNSCDQTGIVWG